MGSEKSVANQLSFFSVLRLLLGTVLLNEFFLLLDEKFYNVYGFTQKLLFLQSHSHYAFTKQLMSLFLKGSAVFPGVISVILLLTSIFLLCGIFTTAALIALILIFFVYFLSHLGTTGTWVFEFVMPLGFALLLFMEKTARYKFCADYSRLNPRRATLANILIALITFFVIVFSKNSRHYYFVASSTSVVLFVLLSLNLYFSKKFCSRQYIGQTPDELLRTKATIFIGLMLSSQVHMDRLINWFTLAGYTNLINIYQRYSTLSPNLHFLTQAIKNNVAFVMPMQASLESFLALCLVILIFKPMASLLSALLFLGLAVMEFGVPATFPVVYPIEYTWTWELLLSTCVIVAIAIYEIKSFIFSKGPLIEKTVGRPVFVESSLLKRILGSLLIAVGMYVVVFLSHNLAKVSEVFSIESALTALFYLILFHLLDFFKLNCRVTTHP